MKKTRKARIKPIIMHNGRAETSISFKKLNSRQPFHYPDGERMNEVAAAEYINRRISTLQNRRSQGLLPKFHKEQGRVVYYRSDLDDYLAS